MYKHEVWLSLQTMALKVFEHPLYTSYLSGRTVKDYSVAYIENLSTKIWYTQRCMIDPKYYQGVKFTSLKE